MAQQEIATGFKPRRIYLIILTVGNSRIGFAYLNGMTLIGPDHQFLGSWINLQLETLLVIVLSHSTNIIFRKVTLKDLALQQLTHKHISICKLKSLILTGDPIKSKKYTLTCQDFVK